MMAPTNKSIEREEDDVDVGALIYRERESQLRKAEAAAASERKKSSSASIHRRTSTRTMIQVLNRDSYDIDGKS